MVPPGLVTRELLSWRVYRGFGRVDLESIGNVKQLFVQFSTSAVVRAIFIVTTISFIGGTGNSSLAWCGEALVTRQMRTFLSYYFCCVISHFYFEKLWGASIINPAWRVDDHLNESGFSSQFKTVSNLHVIFATWFEVGPLLSEGGVNSSLPCAWLASRCTSLDGLGFTYINSSGKGFW